MDRKMLVILLTSLLLLASCSTQTFNYSGEKTENWSADLKVNQTSDDYENQELVLKYKGAGIQFIKD